MATARWFYARDTVDAVLELMKKDPRPYLSGDPFEKWLGGRW